MGSNDWSLSASAMQYYFCFMQYHFCFMSGLKETELGDSSDPQEVSDTSRNRSETSQQLSPML